MKSVHALRTVLSDLIVGVSNFVLSTLLLSAFAPAFLNFVERAGAHARWRGEVFFAIDVAAGVWAMWIYSVVRSKYPSPSRAATVTGLAWWAIRSLQSSKMVGLGLAPPSVVLAPLLISLVSIIASVQLGAWLYEKVTVAAPSAES